MQPTDNFDIIQEFESVKAEYEQILIKGQKLDMSRGKPGKDQLNLSAGLLTCVDNDNIISVSGDTRNYGSLQGISEARQLFADLLGVSDDMVFAGGNSSLQLMAILMSNGVSLGVCGGSKPWGKNDKKQKWLCPTPGYDRHFALSDQMGFENIPVPMSTDGPDMDMIEKLVSSDESIKGIWCVPMYSNPDGFTYSEQTVERFAKLKPAADDFRIFWDNAYAFHHLYEEHDDIPNIFDVCKKYGSENMVYEFASTSKISFAGAGISCFVTSKANMDFLTKQISIQTIGFDKVNQLRHAIFYKDADGVREHMKKHAEILRPKFEMVLDMFEKNIKDYATWHKPKGGYFISVYVRPGCAKRVVQLCKEAGVIITPAGASYPYGNDPQDSNIRIAPTFPSVDELKNAAETFCVAVRYAVTEKLMG